MPCQLLPGELSWPVASKDIQKLVAFCTLCPPQEHRSIFVERVPPEIPELGAMRKLRGPGPRTSSQKTSLPKESMATGWSRKPDEVSSWWLAAEGSRHPTPGPVPGPTRAQRTGEGASFLPPAFAAQITGPGQGTLPRPQHWAQGLCAWRPCSSQTESHTH